MPEIGTSGLMSGEGKRDALQRVTAPFLDSTGASASIESVARLAGHIAADARHRCAENALAANLDRLVS